MRWLLLKDLQILRRSPLLIALLIIYPVVLALLIGAALSSGPANPSIALYNDVPPDDRTFDLGGTAVNGEEYLPRLTESVDVVDAGSRAEAVALVEDGTVLAAVILPADIAEKLATGRRQPTIEVVYNGEDPVKQEYVQSVIKARIADVNAALTKKYEQITAGYIEMLLEGGSFRVLGRSISILGLRTSKRIVDGVISSLPDGDPSRAALLQVGRFATLAIENLGLSTAVLRSVGEPVAVRASVIGGRRTPLDRYAVVVATAIAVMFLAVLLASGLLAIEREEHAYGRLVRGLVSPVQLLLAKVIVAAAAATLVALILLVGIGLWSVELSFARVPWWIGSFAAAGVAVGAHGVAIGALAREVRAASLLAFTLSLPIAFLALVPSGAVGDGTYRAIAAVCAAFPFKAAVSLFDVAVNAAPGGAAGPAAHLAVLAVLYTAIARLALVRFR